MTLLEQEWPGNVRQLENALQFAATVCATSVIHSWDLPPEIARQRPSAQA